MVIDSHPHNDPSLPSAGSQQLTHIQASKPSLSALESQGTERVRRSPLVHYTHRRTFEDDSRPDCLLRYRRKKLPKQESRLEQSNSARGGRIRPRATRCDRRLLAEDNAIELPQAQEIPHR
jgi:hypothetical protein